MKLQASLVPKEEWEKIREEAHKDMFQEEDLESSKRYDFTILVKQEDENFCYSTIRELDRESAYLLYGGVFSKFRGKREGYEGFHEVCEYLRKKYKRIGMATKTKNFAMIKLALNEKFEIVGLRKINGILNVELLSGG